jgi:hypothetical protein
VLQIQHVAVLGIVVLADDAADGERVGAAVGLAQNITLLISYTWFPWWKAYTRRCPGANP